MPARNLPQLAWRGKQALPSAKRVVLECYASLRWLQSQSYWEDIIMVRKVILNLVLIVMQLHLLWRKD